MLKSTHASRRAFALAALMTLGSLSLLGLAGCGKLASAAAPRTPPTASGAIALMIMPQQPGSSMQGPSYMPSTQLVLPAHTLVTITITNQDLGDTSLPTGSPFTQVTGTQGGSAFVDGIAYRSLPNDKVAHTFTVPQLGLNVPVPGDAPAGHTGVIVTFSFMTGSAGTYHWQCMDPCGSGASGWGGSMATMGYMVGTITVQ